MMLTTTSASPWAISRVIKGVCTDLVIRSYRVLDTDLQKLVHEDMQLNFRIYPQLWGLSQPDANIDHRRVPNLQRFFQPTRQRNTHRERW